MVHKKTKPINLNLLSETIEMMNKATDFYIISEIIFNFIEYFVNYNMAVIYKLNHRKKLLEMVSCIGSDAERMKNRMPFKIGEGAVGLVARDKKALLINDVLKSKKIKVRQYFDEDPIIRSFLAVPLVVGDKIIGILSVSCSKPHQYDEYDVQMINIISSQCAVLLELNNNITETKDLSNQILENVNSGVMVINDRYEVVTFNKSSEEITGYTFDEIKGKNIVSLPLKEKDDDLLILDCIKTGKILFEEPSDIIRKDGQRIRIRLSTSLIYNEDSTFKNCICIFRDNTEIEKLQKQIAITDKLAALGRLTAGITHEIRNPLLPIRNASEYLLNKYKNDENNNEVIRLLSIIREESERLNRFLEQLVNLNKDSLFTTGKCNLEEVLEETVVLLKYILIKSNIKLGLNLERKEIILPFNKDNLKQIFLNLLLNSIDAINMNDDDKPRTIDIIIRVTNHNAIIEIIDSGIGIPKQELDKIFDPFYTTKDMGTGFGLPIILNIISNSGGEIFIDSSVNYGTKATLYLPITN